MASRLLTDDELGLIFQTAGTWEDYWIAIAQSQDDKTANYYETVVIPYRINIACLEHGKKIIDNFNSITLPAEKKQLIEEIDNLCKCSKACFEQEWQSFKQSKGV
jgi:hypothetical protein